MSQFGTSGFPRHSGAVLDRTWRASETHQFQIDTLWEGAWRPAAAAALAGGANLNVPAGEVCGSKIVVGRSDDPAASETKRNDSFLFVSEVAAPVWSTWSLKAPNSSHSDLSDP